MRFAFLDTVSGISGDMTLGACVGAGVSFDRLVEELKKLPLSGYHIEMRHVMRSSIQAVKVDVFVHEHDSGPGPVAHLHDHGPGTGSASGGQRATGDTHEHGHHHHHHRSYREIREMIAGSQLSEKVQATAQAIFLKLAEAEAAVHGTTVDEVFFHEVGAVDSIVDIVGTAICMDELGIDRLYSTPVRTGSGGTVRTQHGVMPVPAPATVELLKGYPVELTDIPHELATPTGAAIIVALSSGVLERNAPIRLEAIGYGAGTKEFAGLPNMLRLVVGEMDDAAGTADETLVLLETNIDDMNPELLPPVLERLLETGARDAWLTPILMKKGRPAQQLSVLADPAQRDSLTDLLLRETSTLGVRMRTVARRSLPRETRRVETAFGAVDVKAVTRGGEVALVPEFEECARIARERNLPLIDVYKSLEAELFRLAAEQREPTTPPFQA